MKIIILFFQYKRARLTHDGTNIIFSEDTNSVAWYGIPESYEWWLVEQSVTFMEAIKVYYEQNKTIRCEMNNERYIYPRRLGEEGILMPLNKSNVSAKEILEGKWYIEP